MKSTNISTDYLTVVVRRDSVAAGDDIDAPHEQVFKLLPSEIVESLVLQVLRSYKLPKIAGGNATWCVSSHSPLAVIAQQWSSPRMIPSAPPIIARCDILDDKIRMYFSYFAQADPNVVLDILSRLRLGF